MNQLFNASQRQGERTLQNEAGALSLAARARMELCFGEPWFLADWLDVLMCHLEVSPEALQRAIPFRIHCYQGRAFVSLVFFTMRNMRPRWAGDLGHLLFRPIATHRFLNVRTYVEHDGETGIYFLSEWLPNRFSVAMGPLIFGLPYRLAHFGGQNRPADGLGSEPFERALQGDVTDAVTGDAVRYAGAVSGKAFAACASGSLEEWLMERYTAFTHRRGRRRYFRVWHRPWSQVSADVRLEDKGLLRQNWPWLAEAQFIGANYSVGLPDVWMGCPRRLDRDLA
jgi:uncharacterized protein YqjF (DUF2071 family)